MLVTLIILGTTVFENIRKSIEIDRRVLQSYKTIETIETTRALLKDIEIGKYHYVTTGSEDALEPYYSAINQIEKKISSLKTLARNTRQQEIIRALEPMISQEIRLSERIIATRKEQGFAAAQDLLTATQRQREIKAIQTLFSQMSDHERELLEFLSEKTTESNRNSLLTVFSLIITILGLLIFSSLLTRNYLGKKAELEARLSQIAAHDELTGLYNRRELNRLLRREIERFQRTRQAFSFVLLDIDNFKWVNDTYGHQTGDDVLKWIAQKIRTNTRSVDLPARFGGEEFSLLLPESSLDDAFSMAERIRQAIASTPFESEGQENRAVQLTITISAGISLFSRIEKTEAELISEADQALYQAKNEGRNRCIVFAQ
ncbi:MAG TPA: diguanylate cyclase [Trichocoleus sp.]